MFFLYGRCKFCFVSQSEKVAPTQRCLEHSVKTVLSEQGRMCFCSCQGLAFLSESRGVMPGINSHCCPPSPQLNGHVPSLCLSFPSPVTRRQQGSCVSQKGSFMDMHVSEDHCNKNITEKQSSIFRINICTYERFYLQWRYSCTPGQGMNSYNQNRNLFQIVGKGEELAELQVMKLHGKIYLHFSFQFVSSAETS